jgi:hypothetical protein
MNKEQTEKLWKWCGFSLSEDTDTGYKIWRDAKGNLYAAGYDRDTPCDLTLDSLFKWAVPKLVENWQLEIRKTFSFITSVALNECKNTPMRRQVFIAEEDPAEALAQAILEVIDGH